MFLKLNKQENRGPLENYKRSLEMKITNYGKTQCLLGKRAAMAMIILKCLKEWF